MEDLDTPEMIDLLKKTDLEMEAHATRRGHPSLMRRQGYPNPMHRDEDVLEERRRGKCGELTRIIAKSHGLDCVNDDALRSFKVLLPNGILVAETMIPRSTLDCYQATWEREDDPPSLADFLLQNVDPDTLLIIHQEKKCAHLVDLATNTEHNNYYHYRITEMKQDNRFGILTFENWLRLNPKRKRPNRLCLQAAVKLQANKQARMVGYW